MRILDDLSRSWMLGDIISADRRRFRPGAVPDTIVCSRLCVRDGCDDTFGGTFAGTRVGRGGASPDTPGRRGCACRCVSP
jgi:hypothetical protein